MRNRSPTPGTPVSALLSTRRTELADAGRPMSIRALCSAAGISRTSWYALSDPLRRPHRATITALAAVLELDPGPLLRLIGYSHQDPEPPSPENTGPIGS